MSEKSTPKKIRKTVAQLEKELADAWETIEQTGTKLVEVVAKGLAVDNELKRTRKERDFLRADRDSLLKTIRVLGQEADIADGRAVRGLPRVTNNDGVKEQVQ